MDDFYADPIARDPWRSFLRTPGAPKRYLFGDPLWMIVLSWFAKILSPRL